MSTERVRRVIADLADCTRHELREIADSLEEIVGHVVEDAVSALTRQYEHEVWADNNAGAVNNFSHHTISLQSKEHNVTPDGPRDPIISKEE